MIIVLGGEGLRIVRLGGHAIVGRGVNVGGAGCFLGVWNSGMATLWVETATTAVVTCCCIFLVLST